MAASGSGMAATACGKAAFKRANNITVSEKSSLLELVERHAAIIENKETDKVSTRMKQETWEVIASQFNAISTNKRSADQLKQVGSI
jgi:hypothetical protein